MSARARHLSLLLAVLLAVATPLAVAAASGPGPSPSPSTYRIKSGDTITSIAVQLRLPGGWEQLYKANQDRIGGDPNRLTVGTELTVPQGAAVPAGQGYVVRPGDTLNSIASRLHVAGGGAALYAANRNAIGPDPNRLEVGQTLLPPGANAQPPATQAPKPVVPPAALNRPAAPAPIAAGTAAPAADRSGSGHGTAVLWSVLAGLLFVLFVFLVLFALPRWRRTSTQEVWVGGEYNAHNQPTGSVKQRAAGAQPEELRPVEPPVAEPHRVRVIDLRDPVDEPVEEAPPVRPVEPPREPRRARQTMQLERPQVRQEQRTPPAKPRQSEQRRQTVFFDDLQADPAPTGAPDDPTPSGPAPAADVRSVVAGLQPGSVGRPTSRRQRARSLLSYAMNGLRTDRPSDGAAPQRDLADELLGEVRLVDPTTPLTKDQER